MLVHVPLDAIIGTNSQALSSDYRVYDSRKFVSKGAMAGPRPLTAEAAEIFKRLDALDLAQKDLADFLEIEPNKISKMRTGERRFQASEALQALTWLSKLEEAKRRKRPEAPDQQPTQSIGAGETVGIIQLDLSLSMGPGTLIEDFVESEVVSFDASMLQRITRTPADRLRFVTGIGDSHWPKFQSYDQFLVDINDRKLARFDSYYWITLHDAHGLKRLRPESKGRIQVISENPDYENVSADAADLRIEGRAIWFARGL